MLKALNVTRLKKTKKQDIALYNDGVRLQSHFYQEGGKMLDWGPSELHNFESIHRTVINQGTARLLSVRFDRISVYLYFDGCTKSAYLLKNTALKVGARAFRITDMKTRHNKAKLPPKVTLSFKSGHLRLTVRTSVD